MGSHHFQFGSVPVWFRIDEEAIHVKENSLEHGSAFREIN
jgi:hypothetical protein